MLIVDSHCHLNFSDFEEDFDAVLANAAEAEVGLLQTICTRMSEFETIHKIALDHEQIYCSVGVHPCNVQEAPLVTLGELVEAADKPKVIGLGETGLDYFHSIDHVSLQKESFRIHIEASRQTGLPVIIHCRDAEEDTVAILKEEKAKGDFKALIHCFTGTKWLADEVLKLGLTISLSGILTFKNAKEIQAIAKDLPLDKVLVETDAPYLAPMPHRGKRNEPAYTRHTCEYLAQLKEVSLEAAAAQTTENFFRLFDKAPQP
ncbi:MAG: TatD family hydrolase [Rickettsiales bacterium]|nr:TatD family hydrolase [Rickettsiales bacterium]